MLQWFESIHHIDIAFFKNIIIWLALQLIDDFDCILLVVLLMDTAVDSAMVANSDKFLAIVEILAEKVYVWNTFLWCAAAHLVVALILVIKFIINSILNTTLQKTGSLKLFITNYKIWCFKYVLI
jgi:hypothetical protein